MQSNEEESEICYAALAFHKDPTPESNSGPLPFKIRNKYNSKRDLWSARRTSSNLALSIGKCQYKDNEEDTLSALPEIRLPAPPPPRTHSSALCQTDETDETDEEESPWRDRQKPLLFLGLVVFACFVVVMNIVTWDNMIKKDDSSAEDWCKPLPRADTGKGKLAATTKKITTLRTTKATTPTPTPTPTTTTMVRNTETTDLCNDMYYRLKIKELDLFKHADSGCHELDRNQDVTLTFATIELPYICNVEFELKAKGHKPWAYDYVEVSYRNTDGKFRECTQRFDAGSYDCDANLPGISVKIQTDLEKIVICNIKVNGITHSDLSLF